MRLVPSTILLQGVSNGEVYSGTIKTEIIFWNGSTIKIHNLILKALVCKGALVRKRLDNAGLGVSP
jgi:hypothetical protein